ncbi:MAG: hypothetical protein HFJ80_04605 [Clostridiales bacterium]|nr:hypothetical protein [Clostridiales bacterium]
MEKIQIILGRNISICLLDDIIKTLEDQFNVLESQFSMEQIDIIFNQLLSYSPMREKVLFNGKEESFFAWIQPTISKLEEKKRELEQEKNNWIESCCKIKKAKIKGIVINIIFAIICVIISTLVVIGFKKAYTIALQQNDAELIEFKQNFLHVDEIGNQYIDCLHDYVSVSNVSLKPLADNAVSFTAQLAMSNDVYGIALTQSSKYIIITYSGKVFEYDVFGDHLYYNRYSNIWGEGIRSYGDLAKAQFYGINIDDISYIKITNIELFKLNINRTIVKDKLEIELFSK